MVLGIRQVLGRGVLGMVVAVAGAGLASTPGSAGVSGFPDPAAVGFHHLGLVYDNPQRTAADWDTWVAEHDDGKPVPGGWLFDAFLTLDLTAPSGNQTDVGATTAADWTALLDRWFGTTPGSGGAAVSGGTAEGGPAPGSGTIGAIDAAVTRVAGQIGQPPSRRKIVVTMPWASYDQAAFGTVDGRPADLRVPAERDRVSTWFVDQVRQRFAAAGYRNLDLWGIYLMREDILPGDEDWVGHTAATVHARGLRVAWVPYYRAPGWDRWRSFGLDVAIMQPSYGFRSPADGGAVDAGRLTVTADLARTHGLGVEIEARGSAAGAHEAAMFQQYLAEGARLGYRDGATAHFLGWSTRPAVRKDAYTALADYIGGASVRSVDTVPAWQWSGTTATAQFAARDDLTAVRVELAASGTWRGTVTVEQRVGTAWRAGGTTYAGAAQPTGATQVVLVPLAATAKVVGLRVRFTPAVGVGAAPVARIVLDTVWPIGNAAVSTGAPYTVSLNAAPAGPYGDTADGLLTDGLLTDGLLTDGQWSTTGWWNAKPVGWWETVPVRVLFDLGAARDVDRVELHTHDSPDAAVNWPFEPVVHLSTGCPVLSTSVRGPAQDCGVTTLAGSAPVVTGSHGASTDGTIVFSSPAPVSARYATLMAQPTGWFFADEVRFYARGVDVTDSVTYRLLTPPNPQWVDPGRYGDNGVRLTDGSVAPLMSGSAVNGWRATDQYTVTVDLTREASVREATAWFVADQSWGVVAPGVVTVTTSTDGATWRSMGRATTAARTWHSAVALTATGTARPARYVRFTVPATPGSPAWHMLSQVQA